MICLLRQTVEHGRHVICLTSGSDDRAQARLRMDANELVGRLTCTVPEAGEALGIGRDAA